MDEQSIEEKVTFSFGENWQSYLETVSENEIESARQDILQWISEKDISGKNVIDVGSGSGVHSLSFYLSGAGKLFSFDYDKNSVDATKTLWQKSKEPENWTVAHGSVLDKEYVQSLGTFDIVYSWGVLHHTGSMWEAIENAASLVKPGGIFWISLYSKGPLYPKHLALKKKYNAASQWGKRLMVWEAVAILMIIRLRHWRNPFAWNEKRIRGMNVYHDIIDWLGGLPYEVASADEILQFGRKNNLILERINPLNEGGCSSYLLRKLK